jgi:hypothetical protein
MISEGHGCFTQTALCSQPMSGQCKIQLKNRGLHTWKQNIEHTPAQAHNVGICMKE